MGGKEFHLHFKDGGGGGGGRADAFQAEESSPWKKRGTSFYRKFGLAFHRRA